MYNSIKSIYTNLLSCVQLNGYLGDWFPVKSGVCQGDSLSLVLFATFINDFAVQAKALDAGVQVGLDRLSLLMYADDIVLLTNNEQEVQQQLDLMTTWCGQWGMSINAKKS